MEFVNFLSELTGISDLFSDSNFNCGGIHLIPKGGKLNIHIDFSRAPFDDSKFRRLNVLITRKPCEFYEIEKLRLSQ